MIKNIDYARIIDLTKEIDIHQGQVISKTLSQNENVSLTLFSFDKDEALSTHTSTGDALLQVLEGTARIVIDDQSFDVSAQQTIVMPANVPHSVYALTPFKMLLTVVFADEDKQ